MRRHNYRARMDGRSIIVTDETGAPAAVSFAATRDGRTLYAYVSGVGFIGGWRYPHRKMPWAALAASINAGRLYDNMDDLPTGRGRR